MGNFYKKIKRYCWDALSTLLILWGIFAFVTPFTPGSWLFLVGLFIIFGREKTEGRLVKIMGKKWFNKLKIGKMLAKIPTRRIKKLKP